MLVWHGSGNKQECVFEVVDSSIAKQKKIHKVQTQLAAGLHLRHSAA